MSEFNIASTSGGKDSTAQLLLAIERETPNLSAVFADTGNEHEITYEYVRYLEQATGIHILWVKADFTKQIANKREYVLTHWAAKGVADKDIECAAAALVATGNPFLDLCIWKGRFPSSKAAFCSEELKRNPIINQVHNPILERGDDVISWQGVRADESPRRALLTENEHKFTHASGGELWNYRPILKWSSKQCFDMHKKHGIKHNPLYEQGMGRVGCMPCINCRKDELLEISRRFPDAIERIAQWEIAVKNASKRYAGTFFAAPTSGKKFIHLSDEARNEWAGLQTIDRAVDWAKTSKGKSNYDIFRVNGEGIFEGPTCSSIYGLCE